MTLAAGQAKRAMGTVLRAAPTSFSSIGIQLLVAAFLACAIPAHSQSWMPQRNVELIVPAPAGGSLDMTGRAMQKMWQDFKLVPTPIIVVNRSGANHLIAYNALNQRGGDPHVLGIVTAFAISGYLEGKMPYTYSGFAPITLLLTEYFAFAVRSDSPYKTGKDLVNALKSQPERVTVAIGSPVGGTHHIAVGLPLQSAGVDTAKVTFVGYYSSPEAITALVGGQVDVAVVGTISAAPHVQSGRLRILAVSAPQRMTGGLAQAPTWPEMGLRGVSGSWRALMGGKGMPDEAVAYWSTVSQRVLQSDEFRRLAEKNQWDATFKSPAETRQFMEEQYDELQSVMTYLHLIDGKKNAPLSTQ